MENYPELEFEDKVDSQARLDEVAQIETKYILFATEIMILVNWLRDLPSWISTNFVTKDDATLAGVLKNNNTADGIDAILNFVEAPAVEKDKPISGNGFWKAFFNDSESYVGGGKIGVKKDRKELSINEEKIIYQSEGFSTSVEVKEFDKNQKFIIPNVLEEEVEEGFVFASQKWVEQNSSSSNSSKVFKARIVGVVLIPLKNELMNTNSMSLLGNTMTIPFTDSLTNSKILFKQPVILDNSTDAPNKLVKLGYDNSNVYIRVFNNNGSPFLFQNAGEICVEFELFLD